MHIGAVVYLCLFEYVAFEKKSEYLLVACLFKSILFSSLNMQRSNYCLFTYNRKNILVFRFDFLNCLTIICRNLQNDNCYVSSLFNNPPTNMLLSRQCALSKQLFGCLFKFNLPSTSFTCEKTYSSDAGENTYDVMIVGGGMVGGTMACALG